MSAPDWSSQPRLSRRKLATLSAVGGLAGGLWTVGLASIARSAHPDLTVIGDDDWQIALLEAGTDRMLILSGQFDDAANPVVTRLLTTLRQHVDLILATESALRNLDRTGVLARSVVVQLDAPPDQPDTPMFRVLRNSMRITFAGGQADLERLPRNEWSKTARQAAGWWIRITLDDISVVLVPELESAANVAPVSTALIVAPAGDIATVTRMLPGVAIAANGYGMADVDLAALSARTQLVRTFPQDAARFIFESGRIVLPEWTQELDPLAASARPAYSSDAGRPSSFSH